MTNNNEQKEGMDLRITNLEANLAFQKASQAILYIWDFERRMKPKKEEFKHEMKRNFTELMKACVRIRTLDNDNFSRNIWKGAEGIEKGKPSEHWDDYHKDVATFTMLDMMIAAKCAKNMDNLMKIVHFVQDLEGGLDYVTPEDVNVFLMR